VLNNSYQQRNTGGSLHPQMSAWNDTVGGRINTGFGVIRHSFFKKVGFAFKGYHVHEIEWIGSIVVLFTPQRDQETISYELDVLAHELAIYANHTDGQCVCRKTIKYKQFFFNDEH